jgi:hypothetical protein
LIIILRLIFFITLIAVPAFADDGREMHIRETRLLEEELKLSRKPDIYFVFNLKEKTIHIKARGISLKDLGIEDLNCWGTPVPVNVYQVRKKSAFNEPEREMIKPGESKINEKYQVDAYELSDMPTNYSILMEGGIEMNIKPITKGFVSTVSNTSYSALRVVTRPMLILLNIFKGNPYTSIDIVLSENDARAIYWSLSEKSAAIINIP